MPRTIKVPERSDKLLAPALQWAQYRTLAFQVLLLIDSSGSMKQHQDNLKRNISAYINDLAQSPNKFQIAVTTTDRVE